MEENKMMNPKITTLAALRRLPIGTKLKLTISSGLPVSEEDQDRELLRVQDNGLVFRTKKTTCSYLYLYTGNKVSPVIENDKIVGFQLNTSKDDLSEPTEYRFGEGNAELFGAAFFGVMAAKAANKAVNQAMRKLADDNSDLFEALGKNR